MELLGKETVTLHKVLPCYLSSAVVEVGSHTNLALTWYSQICGVVRDVGDQPQAFRGVRQD